MHKQKRAELLLNLLLILFAFACIFLSKTGTDALGMKNEYLTPNGYSNVLAIGLILSILVQIACYVKKKQCCEQSEAEEQKKMLVAFMMVCSIVYIIGISSIGFYTVTLLCLFVMNMTFEGWRKENIWKAVAFAIGVCLIFFVVFRYLKVFLPKTIFI